MSKRRAIMFLMVLCVGAAVLGLMTLGGGPLYSNDRREWKRQAIAKIEQRLGDTQWIAAETQRLNSAAATRPMYGAWVGEALLVARNGEWMICENVCRKEKSHIHDLFIGRGSDGKWYYSTFHFCVGKCVLDMESQPESLAQFIDGYWLVGFDGRSDECLKKTWENGPWGMEKIQMGAAANASQ